MGSKKMRGKGLFKWSLSTAVPIPVSVVPVP